MIRKRISIEKSIIDLKKQLDDIIKGAVKREDADNETIAIIEKELDNLRSENCFEDTLEGKIDLFERTSFDRIDIILKELSTTTGKSYHMKSYFYSEDHLNNQISLKAPFPATLRERPLRRKI